MARRDLLTDSERRALFDVPTARDDLARHYMLSSRDRALIATRRGDTNRIGFAVQLALMRHPGFGFTLEGGAPEHLVAFMGEQIGLSASAFETYGVRPATASVHAREAGAKAAWSTDRGLPIVLGITDALRASCITLPSPSVIERAGIAGRARARQRTYDALLSGLPTESLAKLDAMLIVDPGTRLTPLAWLREIATAPTPDNVCGLLDRLARVRDLGLPVTIGDSINADRLRQLVREGRASSAQLIGRYTPSRRRATLAAMFLDLEARLTDAVLDMADRIIGGSFTRGNNRQKRSYAATPRDVGRIMRLFDRTIAALEQAQESGIDGFDAVNASVGWDKLLRARGEARRIADLAEENPLIRAADQWSRLHKFAPLLLEAIDFKAGRGSASTIAINAPELLTLASGTRACLRVAALHGILAVDLKDSRMTSMPSPSRRQQRAITIRSDHALARLALLTRDGRSQVKVIEEALDRMPAPKPLSDRAERRARIEAILASVPKRKYPTMAEIDAELYDEDGLPR